MHPRSYFRHLPISVFFFFVVLFSCQNSKEESFRPVTLNDNSSELESEEGLKLVDGANAVFHQQWIIGEWRDDFSQSTAFIFDSANLRYPDTDEVYAYSIDSTEINIDLGNSGGMISGQIDMPSDSVLILIFENEMAIFYRSNATSY